MTRYAIYVVPDRPEAATWFGRPEVRPISVDARRYGFHATVKAPFRLASGRTATDLDARLAAFAAQQEPVTVPALRLACLDGFFALIPSHPQPALQTLAADVVVEFDDLRAPLTEAEIARRRPERLDDRERHLLHTYGYPYVLDRFLFHLTLTDRLPVDRWAPVEQDLRSHFDAMIGHDLVIGSLALCIEPAPGQPFEISSTHAFKGTL
ncbi:DUF1045 domain-containing protein [Cryptosporangium phraense]|uniref:DUF1045 domain-containing protein n=1 Tax=Cryptosporangium phraense TaxID=2593070 RepID=A0A545AL87_9ACTN|nr:DUF1045 domain-containing protein [Cryptosporangium phraense]TQS42072.1 DUF1045 domain-containing protein [Cryptosporangium phraense]